jgi:hypothetical protein
MLLHGLDATDVTTELGALDEAQCGLDNLTHLMKVGRARADTSLQKNFDRLGDEPTVDNRDEYL